MVRPKGIALADKTICRHCKQKEPTISMLYAKGIPLGMCKACRRNIDLRRRVEQSANEGLYKSRPDLIQANTKILTTLKSGTYPLVNQADQSQVGYILLMIDKGSAYIKVYNRSDLFHFESFGIASYLGDLNTLIMPSQRVQNQSTIDPIELEGLTLSEVSERLIWYDRALIAKAAKLLKAEHTAIKQANAAIARAARIAAVQNTPNDSDDSNS